MAAEPQCCDLDFRGTFARILRTRMAGGPRSVLRPDGEDKLHSDVCWALRQVMPGLRTRIAQSLFHACDIGFVQPGEVYATWPLGFGNGSVIGFNRYWSWFRELHRIGVIQIVKGARTQACCAARVRVVAVPETISQVLDAWVLVLGPAGGR